MTTILTKQIGQLTRDKHVADWWRSKEISIPFFDGKSLAIVFTDLDPQEDLSFIDEADIALSNFLQLDKRERLKISDLVFNNYSDFFDAIGRPDEYKLNVNKTEDIWSYVHPMEIYITRRSHRDMDIYLQIQCNCDWEEEHGLQLVFRQGRQLTRVSEIDGHLTEADAYGRPDSEDQLLSLFK
jgi:hypothetical protein